MKNIMKKLRSSSGATLLIVLAFMIFCLFIGASVLAAASVSGSRIRSLNAQQQDTLNQRNMAALLVDELKSPGGGPLTLTISRDATTRTFYRLDEASGSFQLDPSAPAQMSRTLKFKASALPEGKQYSPMQLLLFECAAEQYLDNMEEKGDSVSGYHSWEFENFVSSDGTTVTSHEDFAVDSGEMLIHVTDPEGEDIPLLFCCDPETYSLSVEFQENPLVHVSMKILAAPEPVEDEGYEPYEVDASGRYYDETTESEIFTITWPSPSVEKGSGIEE